MPQPDALASDHWFCSARFGQMITWGPHAAYGSGEQILFRGHLDQQAYANAACLWKPGRFDATQWARCSRDAGMKYAVLISRHHDGYCLWDSQFTDYTSARQAMQTDVVDAYVKAYRQEGLRVGLYYSWADWRIPAFWEGPKRNPQGWAKFVQYTHNQVRELLTNYGRIDMLWLDGPWPHDAQAWRSHELVAMARSLQPDIIINDRLGAVNIANAELPELERLGHTQFLGDFSTLEQHANIRHQGRPWESCDTSTWRLWGYTDTERWREPAVLLDKLVDVVGKQGNLLLNVGPDAQGRFPEAYVRNMATIGRWLRANGQAIWDCQGTGVIDTLGLGRHTVGARNLYLILRSSTPSGRIQLAGLATRVKAATLLQTGQSLDVMQTDTHVTLSGLPDEMVLENLFPVVRLECDSAPASHDWAKDQLWRPPSEQMIDWASAWARSRGESVWVSGK